MTSKLLRILQEQLKCLLLCDSFLDFPPGEALVTPTCALPIWVNISRGVLIASY